MINKVISSFVVTCDDPECNNRMVAFITDHLSTPLDTVINNGWKVLKDTKTGNYIFICPSCQEKEKGKVEINSTEDLVNIINKAKANTKTKIVEKNLEEKEKKQEEPKPE